jgi:DNA-binding response OmpR family regulator
MRVLVVETDLGLADAIQQMLQSWGHRASTCDRGKDAMKNSMKMAYDLVLTEVLLPDMKGDEFISRLKTFSPETHIVAMTWNNSRELESRIRAQGVLYYMVKPFEPESLRMLLDHLSRKSPKATRSAELQNPLADVVSRSRGSKPS